MCDPPNNRYRYKRLDRNNYKHDNKSKPIDRETFKELISNYKEMSIMLIPDSSHVRYRSAKRNPDTYEIIHTQSGKPVVTYKRGGFLISKHILIKDGQMSGYVSLSNKPPNDKTGTAFIWHVQIDKYTKFYKIMNSKERSSVQESQISKQDRENQELRKKIKLLENQLKSNSSKS